MYRIRSRFTKTDLMKFISHLDLVRMMERSLRRSNIPMAFTQGFDPHPKISFATALPIGVSSEGEYMDIEVSEQVDLDIFKSSMNEQLPNGLKILQCRYVHEKSKALMAAIEFSTYIVNCQLEANIDEQLLNKTLDDFMNNESIFITKVVNKRNNEIKKEIDIRPLIRSIEIISNTDKQFIIKMNVVTGSNGNLKPEVVIESFMDTMNIPIILDKTRTHRLDLYLSVDGKLVTPLDIN